MKKNHFILKTGVVMIAMAMVACTPKIQTSWDTAKVEKGTISNVVTATGTVEPITQVEVGTQVSGIINRIYVDYNSVVKRGQLIAEVDKTTLESDLRSTKASLASSESQFKYQKTNYERQQTLFEKQLISQSDFEEAEYQYLSAKSTLERNQADLVKVQTNLRYAQIYSPIDGIVLSKAVEEGQTVAASFSTPTLFTIANDLTKMRVIADVDEADIGQVENGQRVSFSVDAYPNDVFEGEVQQIRLEAATESNVVTYEVVINAPNPDLKLKPGLTANVTIYTLEKKDVLTLPSKALRFTPQQYITEDMQVTQKPLENKAITQKSVWVLEEPQMLREMPVVLGTTNGILVEMVSGLKEGDVVLTGTKFAMPMMDGASAERSPFMPGPPSSRKK